jgi:hypothetical protein
MAATAAGNALSREEQDRMCRDKRRFRSEPDALRSAIRSRRRGGYLGGRVYMCPVCGGYHVSTSRKVG